MLKKALIASLTVVALAVGGVFAVEAVTGRSATVAAPPTTTFGDTTVVAPAGMTPAGLAPATVTPSTTYPSSIPTLTWLRVSPLITHKGQRTSLYVKVVAPGYRSPGYRTPTGKIVVFLGAWHVTVNLRDGMAKVLLPKLSSGKLKVRAFPIYARYYPTAKSVWRGSKWVKTYAIVVR